MSSPETRDLSPAELESEVRRLLRSVRLVFETGFPDDIARQVDALMRDHMTMKMRGSRLAYPACFVFHLTNLAKDRRGREFWSSEQLAHLRSAVRMSATDLAQLSQAVFTDLGLETFDDLVEGENALRYLTPVTMHSGIPALNVPALVGLIETAVRRHRLTAADQVDLWKSTPHGFHGLWASPTRLLRRADPIALDLLERINEALRDHDQDQATLPTHIRTALDKIAPSLRPTFGGRGAAVPRAWLSIEDNSCLGPVVNLPPVADGAIARWRISGSPLPEVGAHQSEVTQVPLSPAKSHEISAVSDSGNIVGSRTVRPYGEIPAYFFSAKDGRMLERSGTSVMRDGSAVIALLHPKASIEDLVRSDRRFGERTGEWSDWQLFEFDSVTHARTTIIDTANTENRTEVVTFRDPDSRPTLSPPSTAVTRVRHRAGEVHDAPPMLRVSVGSVNPELVEVSVEHDAVIRKMGLHQLPRTGDVFDLGPLFGADGTYKVSVGGPLGFSMSAKKIFLCRGLTVAQDPPLLLPGQTVTLTLASDTAEREVEADGSEEWIDARLGELEFRVGLTRLQWAVTLSDEAMTATGVKEFLVPLDETTSRRRPVLHLSTVVSIPMRLELATGDDVLVSQSTSAATGKWSVDLAPFMKMADEVVAESLRLRVVVGHSDPVDIGRIASKYVVRVTSVTVDETTGPAVIRIGISENRPFSDRVARIWNMDRPWEESVRVALDDHMRKELEIRLPADHRIGRHRVWIKVEGDDARVTVAPSAHTSGVVDVDVTLGRDGDPEVAEDRLITAIRTGRTDVIRDGDVLGHGYVLIALLARLISDEGSRALTTQRAGTIFRLVESASNGVSSIVALAVASNVIADSDRLPVSLALLPLVFEAEDTENLHIDEDSTEMVWSKLPWIAAAIEPWSDSARTRARWSERLGWPESETGVGDHSDDDEPDETDADWESRPDPAAPPPRRILVDNFDQDVRRVCQMTSDDISLYLGHLIGTKDGIPLSRDSEWDSVLLSIPEIYPREREFADWRRTHNTAISQSHSHVSKHDFKGLFRQYEAKAVWYSDPQYGWVLLDVVSLAASAVHRRRDSLAEVAALIDAARIAPRWVGFSVLLALSLHPLSSSRRN